MTSLLFFSYYLSKSGIIIMNSITINRGGVVKLRWIILIVGMIMIAGAVIVAVDQKNLFDDRIALEEKFGPLEVYTPKAAFVHYRTEDDHEVFCIKHPDGKYTLLGKWKIKE